MPFHSNWCISIVVNVMKKGSIVNVESIVVNVRLIPDQTTNTACRLLDRNLPINISYLTKLN